MRKWTCNYSLLFVQVVILLQISFSLEQIGILRTIVENSMPIVSCEFIRINNSFVTHLKCNLKCYFETRSIKLSTCYRNDYMKI
jgi:hypothetical protein